MNNSILSDLLAFINKYFEQNPIRNKEDIITAVKNQFDLDKSRSIYKNNDIAIRFSKANKHSFSNTVLSLSALKEVDDRPVIVCIIRPNQIQFQLVNSTFINKISHSSHKLCVDKIRGSFNGSDIIKCYDGIPNTPKNFTKLFAIHQLFSWEDSLLRIIGNTDSIVPTGHCFKPTPQQIEYILQAPKRAFEFSGSTSYKKIESQLNEITYRNRVDILLAAGIDNINTRGNEIEQIITSKGNFHGCEDISFTTEQGQEVYVDVKTKIIGLNSNPKAYNVDKCLKLLANPKSIFLFYFVGLDITNQDMKTSLISPLDIKLISITRVVHHWAGRNSRGVTQLSSDFSEVFDDNFVENIDLDIASQFLQTLIDFPSDEPIKGDRHH